LDTGNALLGQRNYNEATKAYDKAIEFDSKYELAWNNKGLTLKALGCDNEAEAANARAKELGYTS